MCLSSLLVGISFKLKVLGILFSSLAYHSSSISPIGFCCMILNLQWRANAIKQPTSIMLISLSLKCVRSEWAVKIVLPGREKKSYIFYDSVCTTITSFHVRLTTEMFYFHYPPAS